MSKIYSLAILFLLNSIVLKSTAQQIKVNSTTVCTGSQNHFSIPRFALPPSTNIESYTYYVGPDTVTTTENEYRVSFAPGTYNAVAKIALSNGTVLNTNTITFRVASRPIAHFTFANGSTFCSNDSAVCVSNTSIQTSLPLAKALWVWGDNTMTDSTYANACHQYNNSGTFNILLQVIDSIGCAAETSHVVTIGNKINPIIDWEGQPNCFGSTYTFSNNYSTAIKSYSWDFGDGQSYSATSPFTNEQTKHIDSITHTFTIAGPFTPTLSITDSNGCTAVQSQNYAKQGMRPTNIVISRNITSSKSQFDQLNQQTFCTKDNSVYFRLEDEDALFAQTLNAFSSFLWTFNDPMSMYFNFNSNSRNLSHTFQGGGGQYIVKFDISASLPNCIFYDTISIVGPQAKIENASIGITIQPNQKYQVTGADTIDFVNATEANGITTKLQHLWNFDDDFAPKCTAYSVPKTGSILPFTTAQEQYYNSNHFYIVNGTTFSGKMNCRWSLDSLPRHKYTNWDTVFQWYQNGKQFPAFWGIPNIQPNTPILTYGNTYRKTYDPFLLKAGTVEPIPPQIIITPNNNINYYLSRYDTTIYRNGYDVLPNSTQTFYEYGFHHYVVRPFTARLTVSDSFSTHCTSQNEITISHGKSDARELNINGKQCSGSMPNGVAFEFPNSKNTIVLINFDSLADRKDGTPCAIDGFVGYQGGSTPGGLSFPPFFSQPNFNTPLSMWQDGTGNKLYYHYGLNAPANRPPPADTANGFVTIGVIIGSGCANPPFCTQAEVYSDTVWYHNIIQIQNLDSRFTINKNQQYNSSLYSKNESITVYPKTPHQSNVKYDLWQWGDGMLTVDSFLYAKDVNLSQNYTDGYFINGSRRVRYHYSIDNNNIVLIDSIEFPNGYPGSRFRIDSISNNNCAGNSRTYLVNDSALLLLPITHSLVKSSYEISDDPTLPTINKVVHLIVNTNGCLQYSSDLITIGIIDSIESINNTSSVLCVGEKIKVKGYARYFRCDNSITELPFNPNYSCTNGMYNDYPYTQLSFDTLDFWRVNKNQTANIKYTYLNPITNKQDTIYYEKMFWNFGDGSPIFKGLSAEHNYEESGKYVISMITRDSVGGWDTCFKEITVSVPIAKIGFPLNTFWPYEPKTTIMCGEDVLFIDSSKVSDISNTNDFIKTNYWWFGDRGDSTEWQLTNTAGYFNHPYTANGLFNIKLVSESNLGCTDTAHARIFINGPRPAFKLLSDAVGCAPYTVKLANQADMFGKFITPNGTTLPSDTPTRTTYFNFGEDTSPLIVTKRKDTVEYTFATEGQYSIVATGSDAPIGGQNSCDLAVFPNTAAGNPHITITVYDVNTNGIVGKSKVALSASEFYSVSRTPHANYHWNIIGGTITSGNNDSSTIQIIWGTSDGNYKLICHKSTNSCFTSDTLQIAVGNTTSIKETTLNNAVSIYPNPASNQFTVKVNSSLNINAKLILFDMLGKKQLEQPITQGEQTFDVQFLKVGIYFIEVTTGEEKWIQKLIIE